MEAFSFWTNWGGRLSDAQFANAFTALGLLTCRSVRRSVPVSSLLFSDKRDFINDLSRQELIAITGKKTTGSGMPAMLNWSFPLKDHQLVSGRYRFYLRDIDPELLADTWKSIATGLPYGHPKPRLRLKVVGFPEKNSFRPWFRILYESAPKENSAHIDLTTSYRKIFMKWPLRLGYFPGNSAENPAVAAHSQWPASENTQLVQIGREYDNCDILVFDGNIRALERAHKGSPAKAKCNLIILRGQKEDHAPGFFQMVLGLTRLFNASGLIFVREDLSDYGVSNYLINMIDILCHNYPLDIAAGASCSQPVDSYDPLILLSRDLATFNLDEVVDKMIFDLNEMSPATMIRLPSDALPRMRIPPEILDDVQAISDDIPEVKASELREVLNNSKRSIDYNAESHGATGLSKVAKSLEKAERMHKRRDRYILARTFIWRNNAFQYEKRAFVLDMPAQIIICIGPPDKRWTKSTLPVPIEKLPKQKDPWRLKVVISDPVHIREPLAGMIELPKHGKSTECAFSFIPEKEIPFEGRITILHRGRVIQTAVLKIPVARGIRNMPRKDQLILHEIIPVRSDIADMGFRRQFDLSIITNHTSDHRPVLTAISEKHAWLVNLEDCKPITEEINALLSHVAHSVKDYEKGFESKKGEELLMGLALNGRGLYNAIVKSQLSDEVGSDLARMAYLQVVSTRYDEVVPFEFIYDRPAPRKRAKLCPDWKEALKTGGCGSCSVGDPRDTICPLGFWGLSKVIERHDVTPQMAGNRTGHFLQSEPTTDRMTLNLSGPCLFAASKEVTSKEADEVTGYLRNVFGVDPVKAGNWDEWEEQVEKNKPNLIIALPHTEGRGVKASLEIGDDTLEYVRIEETYIRPDDQDEFPLVALLGCDTSGSAIEYGNYVRQFRLYGAGVVIGTIATVFGGHAATVAKMLIRELKLDDDKNRRLGEVMRSVKRHALLNGHVMALCLVAFGDADWKLK